jgi:hypothetical protein
LPPPPPNGAGIYVPNNLVWAILSTLFCCLPLGVVSIVYASQVDGKRAAGDVAGAGRADPARALVPAVRRHRDPQQRAGAMSRPAFSFFLRSTTQPE